MEEEQEGSDAEGEAVAGPPQQRGSEGPLSATPEASRATSGGGGGVFVDEGRHPSLSPAEERRLALRQLAERLGGAVAAAALAQAAEEHPLGNGGSRGDGSGAGERREDGGGGGAYGAGGVGGVDWSVADPESYGLAAASSYGWSR
jgi:hypothetical protein